MGRNAVSYLVLDQSCNFTTEGQRITAANQDTSPAPAQSRKAGLGLKLFFVFAPWRENFSAVD